VGNPDLSPEDRRGLVIFPADAAPRVERAGEWWLVLVALVLVATMIGIAFAVR
jgi:hypothetical protein